MSRREEKCDSVCPRYCPERALPTKAYVPGRVPHDEKPANVPRTTCEWNGELADLAQSAEFLWGVDLFNRGFYWEAHEAWESLWVHARPKSESHYGLQGLIQVAAAMLKAKTEDWDAFGRISARAVEKISKAVALSDGASRSIIPPGFCEQVRDFGTKRGLDSAVPTWRCLPKR